VCVSSASTDLCGGCRVTGIPTVTQMGLWAIFHSFSRSGASPLKLLSALPDAALCPHGFACTSPSRGSPLDAPTMSERKSAAKPIFSLIVRSDLVYRRTANEALEGESASGPFYFMKP